MSDTALSGFAIAQARIAEIQSRFMPAPTPSVSTAASSSDFASALDNAQSQFTSGATGSDVVNDAMKYLGVPYKWGGTDPNTGVDCSGFVQDVYKDMGIQLPRVAADQAKQGNPVASLAQAQPGDLVAFDNNAAEPGIDHIGIYVGNGNMIVAPHTGDVVKIEKINQAPTAIRRIVGTASSLDLNSLLSNSPSSANLGSTFTASPYGVPNIFDTASASTNALGTTSTDNAGGFASLFAQAGQKYGVDPNLLAAVAKAESNFRTNAVSSAGAQGMMQLMPATAQSLGVNPLDPAQAIDGAARLLAGQLQRFGSVDLAVAAYNAGGTAVAKYNGIPPYQETQDYVKRVEAYAQQQLVTNGA